MIKNKLKRIIVRTAVAAVLLMSMPCNLMTAWASNAKIAFSDPSASVGAEVTVTMKVTSTSEDALDRANIMLSYDPAALEFISGTNASGGAGSISVKPSSDGGDGKEMVCTLKFKPLKAGATKIAVQTQEIYDRDEQLATLDKQGESTVTVSAQEGASADAALKSLKVSPGSLDPAFSPAVEEYTVQVGTDVTRIAVSAESSGANATVTVDGDSDLQMGENTVTCRVTAEDGQTVKTYTIHVNKVEGGETAAVTAVGDLTAVINGEQYTVAEAFDMAALPEGFEQVSYSYKGNDVMAARGTEKDLLLLYLTDAQESGAFFIYNESADSWTPYTEISTTSKAIVILPVDKSVTIPEGFTEGIMNLENGKKASGWVPAGEENPKYWLFYGMNWNGDKALYRYDLEENTIQRYFQDPIGANGSITVEQYKEVTDAQQELLHKYDLRGIIILIMGIVIAVLLAVAAVLAGRSGKSVKKTDMAGRTRRRAIAEMAASEELESEVLSREEKRDGKASKKTKGESRRSGQKEPAVQPQKKSVIPPAEEDDDFEVIDLDLDEEDEDEEFEFIDVDEDTRDK